jgi:hypothetical protein
MFPQFLTVSHVKRSRVRITIEFFDATFDMKNCKQHNTFPVNNEDNYSSVLGERKLSLVKATLVMKRPTKGKSDEITGRLTISLARNTTKPDNLECVLFPSLNSNDARAGASTFPAANIQHSLQA